MSTVDLYLTLSANVRGLETEEKVSAVSYILVGMGEVFDFISPREKKALYLRYGLRGGKALTLKQVGKELKTESQPNGVSGSRVFQITEKAKRKIRRIAIRRGLDGFFYELFN